MFMFFKFTRRPQRVCYLKASCPSLSGPGAITSARHHARFVCSPRSARSGCAPQPALQDKGPLKQRCPSPPTKGSASGHIIKGYEIRERIASDQSSGDREARAHKLTKRSRIQDFVD